jgi:hypothetical protein
VLTVLHLLINILLIKNSGLKRPVFDMARVRIEGTAAEEVKRKAPSVSKVQGVCELSSKISHEVFTLIE